MEFAMASGVVDSLGDYVASYNDAVTNAVEFIRFASQRDFPAPATGTVDVIILRDIVTGYHRAGDTGQKQLITILEGVEWVGWDQLGKGGDNSKPLGNDNSKP